MSTALFGLIRFNHPSWRGALDIDRFSVHILQVPQIMTRSATLEHPLFNLVDARFLTIVVSSCAQPTEFTPIHYLLVMMVLLLSVVKLMNTV